MSKVAIVGSRGFKNVNLVIELVQGLPHDSIVVSGGAPGVDSIAEEEAKKRGLKTEIYSAKWDDLSHPDAIIKTNSWGKKYDARAGLRRNKLIVESADIVYAFWDGSSPGTLDSIRTAHKLGKKVFIVYDEQ